MPKKTTSRAAAPAKKKPVATKPAAKKAPVKATPAKSAASKTATKASLKAPAKKPVVAAKPASKKAVQAPVKKPVAGVGASAVKKPAAPIAENKPKTPVKAIPVIKAEQTKVSPQLPIKTNMNLPIVPPDYEPSEKEEFMHPVMCEYFRKRLLDWRDELLRESEETLHILKEEGNMQKPDITDRASEETDLAIEFRTRDRERKLLNKINEALGRIDDGSYGFCEETGDPIPIKRLVAKPTATMTLEAQELHERREKTQRDLFE